MMDHPYIEEQQIADRYVAGTLPADEMERFENHYLSCPECLDRLQLAESLQRGFKRMAGQDAATLATARQLAVVAWLARLGRSRQAAVLAMAVFVLVLLPVGFLRGSFDQGQELAQVRAHLEQERRRSAAESRRAAEAEKGLEASRREVAAERAVVAQAQERLAEAQKPQTNFALLQLAVVRDAGPEESPPSQLHLAASTPRVDVVLEIDEPGPAPYRAILQDARHRELWRVEGLRPNGDKDLTFGLPASLLTPGDYTFQAERLATAGKPTDVRHFSFRVRRPS
jgi:hypothetical protein